VFGLGSIVEKAKALVPKVVNAGKQAASKLANKVANSTLGKAVASIPSVLKAGAAKAVEVTQKVAAAIPKVIEPVKKTVEKIKGDIKEKGKEIKAAAEKKIHEVATDIRQKNERIIDKVKEEWENASSTVIKGTLTIGAIPSLYPSKSANVMLDFLLQTRKAVVEEYPILNWPSNVLKEGIKTIKSAITDAGAGAGSYIYNLNIPGVSDYIGAFTNQRDPNAESNVFSTIGSFARGVVVDGLLGTVDGLANMVADPFEAIEGINSILAYPEKTLPAICSGVKDYVDKKIIHGSAEDRAQAAGQAVFEVASWLVGAGEAKAAATAGKVTETAKVVKVFDKTADTAKAVKVLDKTADTAKVAKATDKIIDTSKLAKAFSKPALKNFGKNLIAELDTQALKASKQLDNFIDGIRVSMNKMTTGPRQGFATDMGTVTEDMLEGFNSAWKSKINIAETNSGKHVNIKPKVEVEDVGKLVDDAAGAGKVLKAGKDELNSLRKKWNVPETDTIAVGKTDIKGLENLTFEGGSPKVRKEAGLPDLDNISPNRPIQSSGKLPSATRHAEEGVANQFVDAVEKAGIKPEDVTGTLKIHQSNTSGVCPTCLSGLGNPNKPSGVIKQLSEKYPNLTIEVTSEIAESAKVNGRLNFKVLDGKHITD
jgi:hypothetical protein